MATAVEVPKLGNTVEECIVARWLKKPGDPVAAGETVAEIETDKATFEVAAPVAGTVLAAFFDEGALVPVFTNLFVIGSPGESADAFRPDGSVKAAAQAEAVPVEAAPVAAEAPKAEAKAGGAMSPRARRFAEEHDFDPGPIAGSGPGGRILEEDVRNAYFTSARVSRPARQTMAAAPAPRGASGIREKIAQRMRESLATTAQYTLTSSADAGGLLTLRARIKASPGAADLNINDLVAFCVVRALLDAPDVNAEYRDGRIHKHEAVHLGFACDTPRGLMVPVVREAQSLTAAELAARMKELAAQAVSGRIAVDDLSGATFTVSNLGGLGIETFTPLLNPPQVAILGVGAIGLKAVRRQGRVEFIDAIALSLTCDHQVIDGAPGARFLNVVRDRIEGVESLCTI